MTAPPKTSKLPATAPTHSTGDLRLLAVNAKQLAELLGVCVRTVRTMDAGGKLLRPVKLNGRAIRWVLDGPNGVRAWLQAGAPDRATWETLCRNGRPGR